MVSIKDGTVRIIGIFKTWDIRIIDIFKTRGSNCKKYWVLFTPYSLVFKLSGKNRISSQKTVNQVRVATKGREQRQKRRESQQKGHDITKKARLDQKWRH